MAERPQPILPSGLDYNSFRRWRKDNNITGTAKELSTAWKEYSSARKSPKRSPSKSPKKSPKKSKKQERVLAENVVIPMDVLRIISASIPPTDSQRIGRMTKASKKTGTIMEDKMRILCREPLTELEILSALESIPLPIGVRFTSMVSYDNPLHGVPILFDTNAKGMVEFHNMRSREEYRKGIAKWKSPVRGYVTSLLKLFNKSRKTHVMLSPLTFLAVYNRRGSCIRLDPEYRRRNQELAAAVLRLSVIDCMARLGVRQETWSLINRELWTLILDIIDERRDPNLVWHRQYVNSDMTKRTFSSVSYIIAWLANNLKVAEKLYAIGNRIDLDNIGTTFAFLNAVVLELRAIHHKIFE